MTDKDIARYCYNHVAVQAERVIHASFESSFAISSQQTIGVQPRHQLTLNTNHRIDILHAGLDVFDDDWVGNGFSRDSVFVFLVFFRILQRLGSSIGFCISIVNTGIGISSRSGGISVSVFVNRQVVVGRIDFSFWIYRISIRINWIDRVDRVNWICIRVNWVHRRIRIDRVDWCVWVNWIGIWIYRISVWIDYVAFAVVLSGRGVLLNRGNLHVVIELRTRGVLFTMTFDQITHAVFGFSTQGGCFLTSGFNAFFSAFFGSGNQLLDTINCIGHLAQYLSLLQVFHGDTQIHKTVTDATSHVQHEWTHSINGHTFHRDHSFHCVDVFLEQAQGFSFEAGRFQGRCGFGVAGGERDWLVRIGFVLQSLFDCFDFSQTRGKHVLHDQLDLSRRLSHAIDDLQVGLVIGLFEHVFSQHHEGRSAIAFHRRVEQKCPANRHQSFETGAVALGLVKHLSRVRSCGGIVRHVMTLFSDILPLRNIGMYASFSRMLGIISVKETDSHIIVNGIPGLRFQKDIYNFWKTSKIANNIFTSVGRSSVKFPKFFAIEVLYILEQLQDSRRTFCGRRTLAKVAEELIRSTWLRNVGVTGFTPRLNYKALDDLNVTLFQHQLNFLHNYDRTTFEYALNGMLMDVAAGGGKTITNFALGHLLGADTKVFVVPKNSVYDVWVKTIKMLFKKGVPDFWHSLSGEEPTLGKEYYIVHFDYLEKFLNFVKTSRGSFGKVFVAIDESHNFNEQSARTQYLIDLCHGLKARDVVHASGTPFKAMGSEAITLLKTVCSDFTNEVEQGFRKLFGKEAKKALEILANRIGIVSFKVVKAEIETPGVDYYEVKVPLKNGNEYTLVSTREKMTKFIEDRLRYYKDGMKEYEGLYARCMSMHEGKLKSPAERQAFTQYQSYVKSIRAGYDPVTMKDMVMFCNRYELKVIIPSLPDTYRKSFLNVRAIIKYVELKVMGEALSQVLGRLRIQCHLDMLPNMPLDSIIDNALSKTVIFTSYVEVVKELDILLKAAGYKPLLVYGETNKDLTGIIKQFDQDPDANPLIATFKSLSTAVPLVMASTEIFTNSPFRDYERTQTIARIDRIGQKHRCSVHETFLDTGQEPNISTRSKDIMQWSKNQVEAILGVQSPDDLEASLEALVENPEAAIDDGEKFMVQLREMLPADTIPQDDAVSMEGLFSSAPSVNVHRPNEVLKTLKETYLSSAWMTKHKFKDGTVRMENGHLADAKNAGETKRVLDKYVTEARNRSASITGIAREFLSGGWKDEKKVAKWMSDIKKDVAYGSRSKQEVDVIAKFGDLPGMSSYRIGGVDTVNRLGDASSVTALAKQLEAILDHKGSYLYGLVEEYFTEKRLGAFHAESDDDIELLDDIRNSGLDHAKDAITVFNAIRSTVDKVERDFLNSPKVQLFEGHFEATYKALWALLTKSTK